MSKEEIIKKIANAYHVNLRNHNFFADFNQELAFYEKISNACVDHKPWEKFILMVETCYLALPKDQRKIIRYDFFYKNYSYWWEQENYPTKKRYLENKEAAINSFYSNLIKLKVININGEINNAIFN